MRNVGILLPLLLIGLTACHDSATLAPSGGKLYEVLLVGDRNGIVEKALSQPVEGLPQSEPRFDVSSIDSSRFNLSVEAARNIVIVSIDPLRYTQATLRYEKNVWAEPQLVVRIGAPTVSALRGGMAQLQSRLLTLLERSEANKTLAMARNHRNHKAEEAVRRQFGIEMWVPEDIIASHRAKHSLWLSNNSPTTMRNLVVYELPQTDDAVAPGDVAAFCHWRDLLLGADIKGETDQMEMHTVAASVVASRVFLRAADRRRWLEGDSAAMGLTLYRGLWEMTGDDMGGPFVSRVMRIVPPKPEATAKARTVIVEAFVFAPGLKKRNAMRELEAMLLTAKPCDESPS